MTNDHRAGRDGLWAGIQLGVFEVIWPTFRWITRIWVKKDGPIAIFIQVATTPDEEAWEDCKRLLAELLDVAASSHRSELTEGYTISYGMQAPHDQGYLELISDSIFRQIAKEVAPWRLNIGR